MINTVRQYRLAIKKNLCCCRKTKNNLMEGFDQTLSAFLEENESPSVKDLYAAFGSPEVMAGILMSKVTPQEQARYQKNMSILRVFTGLFAVLLVLLTIYIWFFKEFRLTVTDRVNILPPVWVEDYESEYDNDLKPEYILHKPAFLPACFVIELDPSGTRIHLHEVPCVRSR